MIDHTCGKCGAEMSSPDSLAGQAETCPQCGNVTRVPQAPAQVPVPPEARPLRKRSVVIGAGAAVLTAVGIVAWVFMPGALDRTLKYAPPGAFGVVRIDVDTVGDKVLRELRKHKDQMRGISDADLAEIEKNVSKIDALDVFFCLPCGGEDPELVGVLRTSLTPGDVMKLQRKFGTESDTLEKTRNGRYDVTRSEERMIFGAEADDLDEGIILFAPKGVLTDKFIAELGTGDNSKLRRILAGVDTSAPVWMAAAMDFIDEADAPARIAGSLDPRGAGSGQFVITFKSAKYAEKALRNIADDNFPMAGAINTTRDGAVVTLTLKLKGEGSFMSMLLDALLLPALGRARELACRASCMANLNAIGKGVMIYSAEDPDGRFPPDFDVLMQPGRMCISPERLHCPADKSGRECSYFYMPPSKGLAAEEMTIIACDLKGNHGDKGRSVLYVSGAVAWLNQDEFQDALKDSINGEFAAALRRAEQGYK